MDTHPTDIPGCFMLQARPMRDVRGHFVKTFHAERFTELGLRTDWREEYFSTSTAGVVRGMHFQTPPADHAKMVFCLIGSVLDVVVDLRRGSPTFGLAAGFELSQDNGHGLYIPTGCAHGFLSKSNHSGMYYKVTSVYSVEHDRGIAWDSIDFSWPLTNTILSDRDRHHPPLKDFVSPFTFDSANPTR